MILVHANRNMGPLLDSGYDQMSQKRGTRIRPCASRCLHDHRAIGLISRLHNGAHLLEIIDVESGNAIVVLGRVIEQLSHGNHWHEGLSKIIKLLINVIPMGVNFGVTVGLVALSGNFTDFYNFHRIGSALNTGEIALGDDQPVTVMHQAA